jgi:hypothetical protein
MLGSIRRYLRRRRDERIREALYAEVAAQFEAALPNHLPTPVNTYAALADWRALMDTYASMPDPAWDVAKKGPIKLTGRQLDAFRVFKPLPLHLYDRPPTSLYGLPIVVVDTVEESTPYTEGWITA